MTRCTGGAQKAELVARIIEQMQKDAALAEEEGDSEVEAMDLAQVQEKLELINDASPIVGASLSYPLDETLASKPAAKKVDAKAAAAAKKKALADKKAKEVKAKTAKARADATARNNSSKSLDFVGATFSDVAAVSLATAVALALAVPGVRDSLLEGDLEGAADGVFETIDGIDNFNVKAATVGAVVATDAVAHLPVLGSLVPGPLEFIGTLTAVLLLERYLLVGEDDIADDIEDLAANLPRELPGDVGEVIDQLAPIGKTASKTVSAVQDVDISEVTDTLKEVPEWFGDSENPVVDIAGPATALAGTYVLGNVARWPLVAIAAPRLLELLGAGVLVYSFQRYGTSDANLKDDLESVVDESKRVVKKFL